MCAARQGCLKWAIITTASAPILRDARSIIMFWMRKVNFGRLKTLSGWERWFPIKRNLSCNVEPDWFPSTWGDFQLHYLLYSWGCLNFRSGTAQGRMEERSWSDRSWRVRNCVVGAWEQEKTVKGRETNSKRDAYITSANWLQTRIAGVGSLMKGQHKKSRELISP